MGVTVLSRASLAYAWLMPTRFTRVEQKMWVKYLTPLKIYDVAGRLIAQLYDGPATAGVHQLVWDGSVPSGMAAAAGVYFYRLESEEGAGKEELRKELELHRARTVTTLKRIKPSKRLLASIIESLAHQPVLYV